VFGRRRAGNWGRQAVDFVGWREDGWWAIARAGERSAEIGPFRSHREAIDALTLMVGPDAHLHTPTSRLEVLCGHCGAPLGVQPAVTVGASLALLITCTSDAIIAVVDPFTFGM